MRPDRPQDAGESLELRDDLRHRARRRRESEFEPAHLGQVRRMVLLETDDYVIVDDIAAALSVSRSLVGICVPYLVAEGILSGPVLLQDPGYEVHVGNQQYSFHNGRWMLFDRVPTGRIGRSGPGRRRRNIEICESGNWRPGSWDGKVLPIVRHKAFRDAARACGLPEDPTGDWSCSCGSNGRAAKLHRWDDDRCHSCSQYSPRAVALGRNRKVEIWPRTDERGPETRPCQRCGSQVRVKRRRGKFVSASHARSVCNIQLASRVLEM